ncbi:MAG: CDP-glycerol glycerophosphotransferase family protein [Lachnospiraceae bacterium]|nr:CDP-glycerol glycerophosphotransferase family protein [Lachnospiraceae bacterium]
MREKIKAIVFHILYPLWYHIGALRPLNRKKAVFVETHAATMSDNFTLLHGELRKRGYETRLHCLRIADSDWGTIIRRSLALIRDISDAGVILLDESNSLFGSFTLRSGSKMIQLWHACGAFKKWGLSVTDKTFGEDEKTLRRYSGHKNYTLVTVSGKEVCWAYEEAFGLPKGGKIVQPVGVSRTDVFFDPNAKKDAAAKIRELIPELNGRRIIAYLPTFRGSIADAKGPSEFDLMLLSDFAEDSFFLIKNHPFVKEPFPIASSFRSFARQIGDELSVEEILLTADVLITDYSSVVFEYSLMNKPMLFYAYDYDSYDLERGFYYPYDTFVPGPILRDMYNLREALLHTDEFDYANLARFRELYMSGCDGKATERIADLI